MKEKNEKSSQALSLLPLPPLALAQDQDLLAARTLWSVTLFQPGLPTG
jgi:hypothetical protein